MCVAVSVAACVAVRCSELNYLSRVRSSVLQCVLQCVLQYVLQCVESFISPSVCVRVSTQFF